MKKILIFTLLLLSLILLCRPNIKAESMKVTAIDDSKCRSYVLMDSKTNTVIKASQCNARLEMASMTKVMSLLLFFEAIEDKRLSYDQELICSERAASKGGSQIFLEVGEKMKVDDLLKSVCIASANDATVVLAEAISGSEQTFVELMNKKAQELELKNTIFSNATGLPTKDKHFTSAYDMAILASVLINKYPKVLEYSSLYEDYVRKGTPKQFWLVNTNKLVKSHPEIDGLKTGWTECAKYCLTATQEKNGMRLISVVMGANTVSDRTEKTLELLQYGFSNYKYEIIYKKGTVIKSNEDILITPNKQNIILKEDFGILLGINDEVPKINYQINLNNAAIKNYQTENIGEISFYSNGNNLGTVELNILEDTNKTTFWNLFLNLLKQIFLY